MARRLAVIIVSAIVLVLGSPAMAAASHGSDGDNGGSSGNDRTRRNDTIWQGLCVGASLDLSEASEKRCERGVQVPYDVPYKDAPDKRGGVDRDHERDSRADKDWHWDRDKNNTEDKTKAEAETGEARESMGTASSAEYAALGDSIAAGLGLGNPAGDNSICGRTFGSYVYQVAESRNLGVNHLACSGATMGDLFTEQGIPGPNIPPQLDGAFAGGTPELITVTAGANDIYWDDFLRKCYADTCGTDRDERVANTLVSALGLKLQYLFRDIERRSGGSPPEVIITGYYNPLSSRCSDIEPRLTTDEITWLGAQTERLNQLLENSSAQLDFVTFAPIDFSGHDICSDDPWVQSLDDPAPFHPTPEGQQAIARAVL